ncbi:MAG: aminotransferase class I/II-fold pyridoxal phosphate-dependent enzyme [Alphaproteobacteria bacterium]|nr:aminotransferase class I/II-fold pyridoxal phosphate-dependent enzyme [Alphaproteobacteria bacterium]
MTQVQTIEELSMSRMTDRTSASVGEASALPLSFPLAMAKIEVHPDSPVPLYEQICKGVRAAIWSGDLPPHTRLPTTREFAQALRVARNTVVEAYTRLVAEGYLVSNTRRGTRVVGDPPVRPNFDDAVQPAPLAGISAIEIGFHARRVLDAPSMPTASGKPFAIDAPDPSFYPRNQLGRLIAEEFRRAPASDQRHAAAEERRFQVAVATYLRHARGVNCDPAQVIAVNGARSAVDMAARVLIDPGHTVQIEDPCQHYVGAAFRAAGARLDPIPTDSDGANPQRVLGPPPRLIFVQSSVNFPFGAQMPENRRRAVLDSARMSGAAIFECDSYGELLYSGGRVSAIQGMDNEGRVLYCGSLNRTLGPGIRAGFLVVPPPLVEAFSEMARRIDYGPELYVQAALATFLEQNDYALHVKRVRAQYSARLQMLRDALRTFMPNVRFSEPKGGLHIVIYLSGAGCEASVCAAATAQGLSVSPLSQFYLSSSRSYGLVLGFGSVSERMIEPAVKRLASAVQSGLSEASAA